MEELVLDQVFFMAGLVGLAWCAYAQDYMGTATILSAYFYGAFGIELGKKQIGPTLLLLGEASWWVFWIGGGCCLLTGDFWAIPSTLAALFYGHFWTKISF